MSFVPDGSANFGERLEHRCGACGQARLNLSFSGSGDDRSATIACGGCKVRRTLPVSIMLPLDVEARLLRYPFTAPAAA